MRRHRSKAGTTNQVVLALSLGLFAMPTLASDAELRQILNRQGCTSFSLTENTASGNVTLYKVNCFGSSHRKLDVVCKARSCRIDEGPNEVEPEK